MLSERWTLFSTPGRNALFLNDGRAVLTDGSAGLPIEPLRTTAVVLGDLDGDGDPDAVIGRGFGYTSIGGGELPNLVLRNQGGGAFSDVTSVALPGPEDDTMSLALGDLNGDGHLDLIVGNAEEDRLYRNTGTGIFVDESAVPLPPSASETRSISLGDLDGDGDTDVALGGGGDGVLGLSEVSLGGVRVLANGGSGVLQSVAAILDGVLTAGPVVLTDLDLDGDRDLWVSGLAPVALLHVERQLARRHVPRIGRPLAMDLYGPAGAPWILARSPAQAAVPLPPFGVLRVDPTMLAVVGSGNLDAAGRASASFLVPADPSLVGASFYWQSLVASPPLLTNLEITTVTDL